MDDRAEALPAIERVLARHGVTSYFPTTVTAPMESTLRALERLADAIEAGGWANGQGTAGGEPAAGALFRWAYIWKGRSLAMRGAECILRRICFRRESRRLSVSGRRRAGTFAS